MKNGKGKRLKKFLLFAGLGVMLAISAVFLIKYRQSELSEKSPPAVRPVPVHTARVKGGRLPIVEHYIGTIEPLVYADLSPRITGHLYAVAGDVGDTIKKGEAAAVLDARLPKREEAAVAAELKGARESLVISEKIYERRQVLVRDNHVSEETLDEARRQYVLDRARVKKLEKELSAAEVSVQYTRITSPFDGTITRRMKDPGDLTVPGTPVLRVEQPGAGYKILVHVPRATADRLAPGDTAVLKFKDRRTDILIDRIQPAISPGALATIEIRVKKKPFGLLSGSKVGVDMIVNRPEGLIVPLSCLLEQDDACHVFIVDEKHKTARSLPVKLLGKSGGLSVVEGEIPVGSRLVSGSEAMLITLDDNVPVQPVGPEGP